MSVRIRKDDLVEICRGEEKGKRGKVLRVIRDKKRSQIRVLVDGVNLAKRHRRMTRQGQPGGIMDTPLPLAIANVALLCPKCGKRTKVRYEKHEGHRVRICRLADCGEVIDKS
ncbi:MAG: 50S ribosomal protein L24 [candidate division WOR-3 bacterium]